MGGFATQLGPVLVTSLKASISLLGPFVLTIGGQPQPALPRRVQGLLALLALRGGQPLSREVVADMLWPDSGPEEARHSLRQALVVARRALGEGVVKADGGSLAIPPDSVVVDALEFDRLAVSRNADDLARCAALYRGELLQDLLSLSPRFDEWLAAERRRLGGLAASVYRRLMDAKATEGDVDAAIAAAQRLVALDDLDEDAHRRLILLFARAGRRSEAVRQYEACVAVLRRELDVEPEPQTIELGRSIRAGTLAAAPPAAPIPVNVPSDALRPAAPSGFRRWGSVGIAATAACIAVAAAGALAFRQIPSQEGHVAVAPFADVSAGATEEVAIAGFADLIFADLQETHFVRSAVFRADDRAVEIAEADPAAQFVLTGSAAMTGSLDASLRLTDRRGVELWSQRYQAPLEQALDTVGDITSHIARAVDGERSVLRSPADAIEAPPRTAREMTNFAVFIRSLGTPGANSAFHQIMDRTVMRHPDDAAALGLLANAHLTEFMFDTQSDHLAEANRILEHALRIDPSDVPALWDKCFLRRLEGRIQEATEICLHVLSLSPHHAGAMREIAHDLMMLNDFQGAIGWFQAAIDAGPRHPFVNDAYFGIAACEHLLGHTERAFAVAQESLKRDSTGNLVGLWLAIVLEFQGRHGEAQTALAEFYRRHPEFPPSSTVPARIIRRLSPEVEQTLAAMRRLGVPDIEPH